LAAERDVDRVLGYEMDRFTPFAAPDVVWQAAVLQRDHAQRRLLLRLNLVPRRAVQSCLDLLSHAGLRPECLEAIASDGTPRRLPLADHSTPRSHRVASIAAGVVAGLAMAILVTPFITQWLASSATEAAIAALQPQVTRVEALRKHLADASSDALGPEW